MVPQWFSLGMLLVLIGGLLVMVGFFVDLVGVASLNDHSTLASIQSYQEGTDALVGIGFFLAVLGWVFHQVTAGRRR
jgi:hypothetical protein